MPTAYGEYRTAAGRGAIEQGPTLPFMATELHRILSVARIHTVSDQTARREQKKAQTRVLVRTTAHRLFAARGFEQVTIADIAGEADVAVQTVFNHFSTKEDLFFDGRVPWVEGVADAVLDRAPGRTPVEALRIHLLEMIVTQLNALGSPEERGFRATLEASQALLTHERTLVFEAENRLTEALLTSWQADGPAPPNAAICAPLTAALWLGAVRVLIVENRLRAGEGGAADEMVSAVETLCDRVLGHLQAGVTILDGLPLDASPAQELPERQRVG